MSKKFSIKDFEIKEEIGTGRISVVSHGVLKSENLDVAIKILESKIVLKEGLTKAVFREKEIVNNLDHENIIKLIGTFKTKNKLYFVYEYCPGRRLRDAINKCGTLSLEATRFFVGELVNALEYLHSLDIVHRDVKASNIMFDKNGHVKLVDFGCAKMVVEKDEDDEDKLENTPKTTWVGTPHFVPPELLSNTSCSCASDLWALGVLIYHCLSGKYPFSAASEYFMFQKIKKREFKFPKNFNEDAKDIVDKLLQIDPKKRIGAGEDGYKLLKAHPFFKGIEFDKLKDMNPPKLNAKVKVKKEIKEEHKKWMQFLLKNESIVYTGPIVKKRHLSFKKRQLLLTDRPRLIYIDPEKMCVKGTIPLSKECITKKKSDKKFVVKVPGRDYLITDVNANSDIWVKHISRVSLCGKKKE